MTPIQPTLYEQTETGKSPEYYVMNCTTWIIGHCALFLDVQRLCLDMAAMIDPATGKKLYQTISRDDVYAESKRQGYSLSQDPMWTRDHNLWSPLSRYIVQVQPSLANRIRTRKCSIDDVWSWQARDFSRDWRYVYKESI